MKLLFSLIICTFLFQSFGQESDTPAKKGSDISNIIPDNWRILDSITGDLNKDGIKDLVFAIQNTDTSNIEANDGFGIDSIDLNPRILGIYFGTEDGFYIQELISYEFIIPRDSPTMDEPFDGFSLNDKGVLDINYHFWFSAGSWSMSNLTYRFRYQDNAFTLIGYDSYEGHRASGETTEYSVNFLSRKMKISKGNFSNDEPDSVEWKSFKLEKLFTIHEMYKPFETPFEGLYL